MTSSELESNILRMLDGELPADEIVLLEAELLENGDALSTYRKLARLHSTLETRYQARSFIGKADVIPIKTVMIIERKRQVKMALGAAAAIILLAAVILALIRVPQPSLAGFRVTEDSVFTLTHANSDGGVEMEGQILAKGSRLRLQEGMMEGVFKSGVLMVAEAPCDLRVIAEGKIALGEGTVWFEVPEEAVGFTVETPEITVVDLGTTFGIFSSKADPDEVHVTRGAVEVTSRVGDGPTQTLREGEARRVEESGDLSKIATAADKFSKTLPSDDGLVGRWEFESQSGGITGDSSGNGHSGRLEGGAGIVADAKRGNSLKLSGLGSDEDGVDINSVREIPILLNHRGVTLAAWIKRNPDASAGGKYSYVIGLGEGGDHPIASIGISDSNGCVTGFIEGDGGSDQVEVVGDTAVVDGVWTHIAITFDRVKNRAITYVNGVPDGLPTDISIVGDGVLNWNYASIGRMVGNRGTDARHFGGLIDDARIYNRPLSPKEIADLAQ